MLLLAGWNNLNQHATGVIPIQRHDFNGYNHLTSEDSEPPELEHVFNDLDEKEYSPQQSSSSSSLMQGSHLSSTSELSAQQSDDWYVFDPIFGVIPRETRDLWRQQQQQAVEVASMDRSRGMMRSISGGGIARTRSVNRPVRYSNEKRMTEDGCSAGSSSEVEMAQGSTVKLAVDGESIS